MSVYIHQIETAVPEHAYAQAYTCDKMSAWVQDDRQRKLVCRAYRNAGIRTRHSVLDDFKEGGGGRLFTEDAEGRLREPGTAERNDRFAEEARHLAVHTSRQIIENTSGIATEDITHVITVSCTGFVNPGPDFHVARELGLRSGVQRYALGFMGCYASIPALRMAHQFCMADPSAVVLVLSIELCTLHLHIEDQDDTLLANGLFADGAAAALVSARDPAPGASVLSLDAFSSALIPEGEADMTWRIGNKGFELRLSAYVPRIIGGHMEALVDPLLEEQGLRREDIDLWAVHPGGRAIVDRVRDALGLSEDQLQASRSVLERYGNMSSATSLFVLKAILDSRTKRADAERVLAVAFGPGLTVETALLTRPAWAGADGAAMQLPRRRSVRSF